MCRARGNTFTGAVTIDGNTINKTTTVSVASIGTAGSASPLGSFGTIKIGSTGAGSINSLAYIGAGEATDKVIDLAGTGGEARLVQNGSGKTSDARRRPSSRLRVALHRVALEVGRYEGTVAAARSAAGSPLEVEGCGVDQQAVLEVVVRLRRRRCRRIVFHACNQRRPRFLLSRP